MMRVAAADDDECGQEGHFQLPPWPEVQKFTANAAGGVSLLLLTTEYGFVGVATPATAQQQLKNLKMRRKVRSPRRCIKQPHVGTYYIL